MLPPHAFYRFDRPRSRGTIPRKPRNLDLGDRQDPRLFPSPLLRCLLLLIQRYLFIDFLLPLSDRCSNRFLFGRELSDNPEAKRRCR